MPVLFAGTRGFGEWAGEVWGAHVGWSSNYQIVAEVVPDGRRVIALGELLHPGEVVLEPGQSYSTPEVYATYSPLWPDRRVLGLSPAPSVAPFPPHEARGPC